VGVVLVLAVIPFTWELSYNVRMKKEKRRGNEMWTESGTGCGRGGAGWRGWREEGGPGAGRLVPFGGFKSPISGHLMRMKGQKEMPFVRNPGGPNTGRGVSSKTSHSFT